MKRWFALAVFTAAVAFAASSLAGNNDADWKKVEDAVRRGLPRTAIEALEPIMARAIAEENFPEAARAIARRIVLEGTIEGNRPEERIVRMQAALETAPEELRPLFHTLLAHWYWNYFQQNRWRFLQRTATAEPPGEDFTTWDLARLFAEIDRQFARALESHELLKKTPVESFDGFLNKGTLPDRYRPTLFDFLAHEALSFYTTAEQAGARPQDDFRIPADSPIFGTSADFLAWELPAEAGDSPKGRAVHLFQELLRFHQTEENATAFADLNLARLVFGKNAAVGPERDPRYRAALQRFVEQSGQNEVTAMALVHLARALQEQEELVEAHATARKTIEEFPRTPASKLAANLIAEIEHKSAAISTERIWNAPWPEIRVDYRNVNRVYFRAVRHDWEAFLRTGDPDNPHQAMQSLLRKSPAASWQAALPLTDDYRQRTEAVAVPETLAPGFYVIIASHDARFREGNNQISFAPLWVSDLSLILRTRAGKVEGFVTEANSGLPVPEARLETWTLHWDDPKVRPLDTVATDAEGFFSFDAPPDRYVVRATVGDQQIGSLVQHRWGERPSPTRQERVVFFTDRAIYRPGQSIHYKGIALRVDQERNNYEVIAARRFQVLFRDANGQEIARQQVQSNDYGSFSGTFTAPQDRLTGAMRIEIPRQGVTHFRVEEYKRPRFIVTLEAPDEAPRLNQAVRVPAKALSYTGAPVDGAEVRYRVVREVRFPWWRTWFSYHRSEPQEIAHGTARTGVDGTFHIEFVARPDLAIPEEDEPAFTYRIHADVTDGAGETRSAERRVSAGYTALEVRLEAAGWQTVEQPVDVKVRTLSLDGEHEPAEGILMIYTLQQPERAQRPPPPDAHPFHRGHPGNGSIPHENDPSHPANWPLAELVAEEAFSTAETEAAVLAFSLPAGVYRAVIETRDRFEKEVTAEMNLHVLEPAAADFPTPVPHHFSVQQESVEPGETFRAVWGTGYESGQAFVEIEHRHQMLQRAWTGPDRTQELIEVDVTEEMRGGFTVHVTFVRENRLYTESRRVEVPWSNKKLDVRWEHFRSKLDPNEKETWTAVVTGPEAEKAAAEMVATLYDASLDAFVPHPWIRMLNGFYTDQSSVRLGPANIRIPFQVHHHGWDLRHTPVEISYRSFPHDLVQHHWGYPYPRAMGGARGMPSRFADGRQELMVAESLDADAPMPAAPAAALKEAVGPAQEAPAMPDLSEVAARTNLQETAFFFPQITSDEEGVVRMTFTMPEALTEWRFMGFAHDREMRSGFLEGKTVTSKDLMVQPNPPRFLREGDVLEFTVKVTNQSEEAQQGKVRLTFTDAMLDRAADEALENLSPEQAFDIPANESRSYSWRIAVPDGLSILTYRAVAASPTVSDGEEGYLPVLSRRVLVRESIPLPIRGPAEREFVFEKLLQSARSDTIQHQGFTVQMVSNPAWYAVLALPYLMEFPYECTEQTFNRFYANALARHIANSDPKIRRTFDLWKNTPALDSPLEKNEELKNVVLQETPWVRQAQSESQARRNVGILFDDNRLNHEFDRTLQKLIEEQYSSGAWPWFPGGRPNEFITLYITTGFARMRHLGMEVPMEAPLRALQFLDAWIDQHYRELKNKGVNNLTPTIALYLYARSFTLDDRPVAREHREAFDYFVEQAQTHWLALGHRKSQGHLALALHRFGDKETPGAIMNSLRERAVRDEEMGMFWRDLEFSWWWYRAPIETQALMIEAFDEVAGDAEAVEECKVWLLKQKQTQDWKTTKATADAVYALLLRGTDLLASDEIVQVSLGEGETRRNITPARGPAPQGVRSPTGPGTIEPGTGFYEVRFSGAEVGPEMGRITVQKVDEGVAWGGAHWQYLEDISKVTPHEATPLKLQKQIFTRQNTPRGPVLQPVNGAVAVGDELVVRIILRSDRDMEYLHLKDHRGSGLEPLNVLSRYRYQDGLGYYESTRDTASHFFIDYLPKGVYVFEYPTRVFHRGSYQTGFAEIQSMYAPEFSSHSESIPLEVR
jgi:hypothetical protein